jgi:hypothetical protein
MTQLIRVEASGQADATKLPDGITPAMIEAGWQRVSGGIHLAEPMITLSIVWSSASFSLFVKQRRNNGNESRHPLAE